MLELVVATIVATAVLATALGLIVEQRRNFLTDQARSDANQNLRIAMEFMGNDIEMAGEYMESNVLLPGISLINGSGSDHDEIVAQRKLVATNLILCEDLGGSDDTIVVSVANPSDPTQECTSSFSDAKEDNEVLGLDALTDNLNDFRDYRCQGDGCTRPQNDIPSAADDCDDECILAYIHNPVNGEGEFFLYTNEECVDVDSDACADHIAETGSGMFKNVMHVIPLGDDGWVNTGLDGDWANAYDGYITNPNPDQTPKIYLIEERKYTLVSEDAGDCDSDKTVLAVVQNRQDNCSEDVTPLTSNDTLNLEPMRLVNNINDIDITIETASGTVTTYNETLTYIDDWQDIKYIEIDLEAFMEMDSDLIRADVNQNIDEDYNIEEGEELEDIDKKRRLSTRFYPRNAISQ